MRRISLDTNILIYAVDRTAGNKNATAKAVLRAAALGGAVITQQVIGEFLNVSRRMAHLNQHRLRRIAAGLCTTFPIAGTRPEALFDAFDLAHRHALQFWDAVILTVCRESGVEVLITEDLQDGLNLDGLTVLNPFLPVNTDRMAELLGQP